MPGISTVDSTEAMRASQESPSLQNVPESAAAAVLVPFSLVPQANRSTVAICSASFADFLQRNGARGERRLRVLEGGAYRIVGAKLSSGRHALLVKYDDCPAFEISLEVWRGLHVHRRDFYETLRLLAVPPSSIQFCDGAVLWR